LRRSSDLQDRERKRKKGEERLGKRRGVLEKELLPFTHWERELGPLERMIISMRGEGIRRR